jgi:hypothetical protein
MKMSEKPRYSHAYDFAFEVKTDKPHRQVTPAELRAALLERATRISDAELLEACGPPYDTTEDNE